MKRRSNDEMYALIFDRANRDEHILAVLLNGSRANPLARVDEMQDFDIVYVVDELEPWLHYDWTADFGPVVIMQEPEGMTLFPPEYPGTYAWLMLFVDGNRIDLTLVDQKYSERYCHDPMTICLLDKTGAFQDLPEPTAQQFYTHIPSEAQYQDALNEFFWVSTYVAKGLWRHEYFYAAMYLNDHMRRMLLLMVDWLAACRHDGYCYTGKCDRYLSLCLDEESCQKLMQTYRLENEAAIVQCLKQMIILMREFATEVAEILHFTYPQAMDQRVVRYLERTLEDSQQRK